MIKTPSSATAIDFSPADSEGRYVFLPCLPSLGQLSPTCIQTPGAKWQLALKTELSIFWAMCFLMSLYGDLTLWLTKGEFPLFVSFFPETHLFLFFSSIAHDNQIHRLSWRPAVTKQDGNGKGIGEQLASCSEDGTLKVLIIHTENGPMNH